MHHYLLSSPWRSPFQEPIALDTPWSVDSGIIRFSRRDGRVAEGGGLLNRYRVKSSIGGSNPPLSAIYLKIINLERFGERSAETLIVFLSAIVPLPWFYA